MSDDIFEPVLVKADEHPIGKAVAFLVMAIAVVFLICSPAIVIAVYRALL